MQGGAYAGQPYAQPQATQAPGIHLPTVTKALPPGGLEAVLEGYDLPGVGQALAPVYLPEWMREPEAAGLPQWAQGPAKFAGWLGTQALGRIAGAFVQPEARRWLPSPHPGGEPILAPQIQPEEYASIWDPVEILKAHGIAGQSPSPFIRAVANTPLVGPIVREFAASVPGGLKAWEALTRFRGPRAMEQASAPFWQMLQEPAYAAERTTGAAVIAPQAGKYGLEMEDWLPLTERTWSLAFAQAQSYMRTEQEYLGELGKYATLPGARILTGARAAVSIPDEYVIADSLSAIASGQATAEQIALARENLGAELVGQCLADPLQLLDFVDASVRLSRAAHLTAAQARMATTIADNPKALKALDVLRAGLERAGADEAELLRLATEAKGIPTPVRLWGKVREVFGKPFELVPEAKVIRDLQDTWIVLAGPLTIPRSGEEAVDLLRMWVEEPEALRPFFGKLVDSPAGKRAAAILEHTLDDIATLPTAKAEMFDALGFIGEADPVMHGALRQAHGWTEPNQIQRFFHGYKALISEFYLTGLLSPAYAIRNFGSDFTGMAYDGLATFERSANIDKYFDELGAAFMTRRIETKGTGLREAFTGIPEGTSKLPWPLNRLSIKGQEIVQHAEPFGILPLGEEARYRRAYYMATKHFFNLNAPAATPALPAGVAQFLGPRAEDLRQAVSRELSLGAKRRILREFMDAETKGKMIDPIRYIDPELLDSVSPEMVTRVKERLSKLTTESTVEDVRAAFDELGDLVDQDELERYAELEILPEIQGSPDVAEVEIADRLVDDLEEAIAKVADEDPRRAEEMGRELEELKARIPEVEEALDTTRREAVDALVAEPNEDGLEVLIAAYRDTADQWDETRKVLDRLRKETIQEYRTNKARKADLWGDYFRRARGEWEDLAQRRIARFGEAREQLARLAAGEPLEDVLGSGKWIDQHVEMLKRASDVVPEPDKNWLPGSVLEAENDDRFAAMLDWQRSNFDRARARAWRAVYGSQPENYGPILDLLDSAERDIERYGKATAGRVKILREKAFADARAAYAKHKSAKHARWAADAVWEKYYIESNDAWNKFWKASEQRWKIAERDILIDNYYKGPRMAPPQPLEVDPREVAATVEDGDLELVKEAITKKDADWTPEEKEAVARWTGAGRAVPEPVQEVLPRPVAAQSVPAYTRDRFRADLIDTFGASEQEADGVLALWDAVAEQWSLRTGRQPQEFFIEALGGFRKGEAPPGALLQRVPRETLQELNRAIPVDVGMKYDRKEALFAMLPGMERYWTEAPFTGLYTWKGQAFPGQEPFRYSEILALESIADVPGLDEWTIAHEMLHSFWERKVSLPVRDRWVSFVAENAELRGKMRVTAPAYAGMNVEELADEAFVWAILEQLDRQEKVITPHIPAGIQDEIMLGARRAGLQPDRLKSATRPWGDLVADYKASGHTFETLYQTAAGAPEFRQWFKKSGVVDEAGKPRMVYHGTQAPEPFGEFSVSGPPLDERGGFARVSTSGDPTAYMGAHFAEEPEVAGQFAGEGGAQWLAGRYVEEGEAGPRVYPAYLSIQNHKDFATEAELRDFIYEMDMSSSYDVDGYAQFWDGGSYDEFWDKYEADPVFRYQVHDEILTEDLAYGGPDPGAFAAELGNEATRQLEAEGFDGVRYGNQVEGGTSWIAFEPQQIKSPWNLTPTQDPRLLYQSAEDWAPRWFYKAEQVITAKMPERATVEQVRNILTKGGIKKDELQWNNVLDWLGTQEGMVSKDDVLTHLMENRVQVEEVTKGAPELASRWYHHEGYGDQLLTDGRPADEAWILEPPGGTVATTYDIRRDVDLYGEELVGGEWRAPLQSEDWILEENGNFVSAGTLPEMRELAEERMREILPGAHPRHGQWQLPGGEDYRELLLILPWEKEYTFDTYLAAHRRMWPEDKWAIWNEAEREAFRRTFEEEKATGRLPKPVIQTYRGSHWDEDNVLAHVRFNERTGPHGERILFIEEIQSDWHQKGRELRQAEIERLAKERGIKRDTPEWKALQREVPQDFGYADSTRIRKMAEELEQARQAEEEATAAWERASDQWDLAWKNYQDTPAWEPHFQSLADTYNRLGAERQEAKLAMQHAANMRQLLEQRYNRMVGAAVPAAPFAGNWDELSLKRMYRWAAENDFDAIAWTTGAQQADRYNLSKVVDRLEYDPATGRLLGWKDDLPVGPWNLSEGELPEYVGKDIARRLVGDETIDESLLEEVHQSLVHSIVVDHERIPVRRAWTTSHGRVQLAEAEDGRFILGLGDGTGAYDIHIFDTLEEARAAARPHLPRSVSGPDLQVGGQGMAGFYDQILPYSSNKLTKRWGVQVEDLTVADPEWATRGLTMQSFGAHGLYITPQMKRDLLTEGLPLFQHRKGAVQFLDDGRAIIHAFEGADITTVVHESAHIFRRYIEPEDLRLLETWAGVTGGNWETKHEELFARAFERYMAEGNAPTPQLQSIFDRFKEWILSIYRAITGSQIDVEMNDVVRGIMDRMLAEAPPVRPGDWRGKELEFLAREQQVSPYREALQRVQERHPLSLSDAAQMYGMEPDDPRFLHELENVAQKAELESEVRHLRAEAFRQAHQKLEQPKYIDIGGYTRELKYERVLSAEKERQLYWTMQGVTPPPKGDQAAINAAKAEAKAFRQRNKDIMDWYYSLAREATARQEGREIAAAIPPEWIAQEGIDALEEVERLGGREAVEDMLAQLETGGKAREPQYAQPVTMYQKGEEGQADLVRRIDQALERMEAQRASAEASGTLDTWEQGYKSLRDKRARILAGEEFATRDITGEAIGAFGAKIRDTQAPWKGGLEPGQAAEIGRARAPQQVGMFDETMEDMPLWSGAAQRVGAPVFRPEVTGAQTMLPGMEPEIGEAAKYAARPAGEEVPEQLGLLPGEELRPKKIPKGQQTLWQETEELDRWQIEELETAAARVFGTTYDPREAGFILQDGTMIDFSGKRAGGTPGMRSFDHRDIWQAFEEAEIEPLRGAQPTDTLQYFLDQTGAMRISVFDDWFSIDVAAVPSEAQRAFVNRLLRQGLEGGYSVETGARFLANGQLDNAVDAIRLWRELPDMLSGTLYQTAPPGQGAFWHVDPGGWQQYRATMNNPGAVNTPLPQNMLENTNRATRKALDQMRDGIVGEWDQWQPAIASREIRQQATDWLNKEVTPRWYETLATGMDYGKAEADRSLLDYSRRRNLDEWVGYIFPYHYWFTRAGWNWAQRLAAKPSMVASYFRIRDAMRQANENAGRRQRFGDKIRVPFPWLPDWMGGALYVDPLGLFLPLADMLYSDRDDPEEAPRGLQRIFKTWRRYGLRPYHFWDYLYQSGKMAQAGEFLGMAPGEAQQMLGPDVQGDFGTILPQSRVLQALTAAGRGVAPEALSFIPPGGINIEAPLRRALGLQAGEVWDPYRINRMLGNLAAEDPTNWELARATLMAQALVEADENQTGAVWDPSSPIAQQVAQEYNWTPDDLAQAQQILSLAMQRAQMERGMGSLGWLLGPQISIEPAGERAQMEMAEQARGTTWSPEQPTGSRAAYQQFKEEYPAMYPRATQYGVLPGETSETMAPGARANWMVSRQEKAAINAQFDQMVDALIRAQPWNTAGRAALDRQRYNALKEVDKRYPMPAFEGDMPAILYGMNPDEMWDSTVEQEIRRLQTTKPDPEAFRRAGEIDWSAYYDAVDKWRGKLPGAFTFGDVQGGTYAGMNPDFAIQQFDQRHDSPLEAAQKTYQDAIASPAWDAYHRTKDYPGTVGQVGPITATALIPYILAKYPVKGWNEQQLQRELQGVVFPSLSDQQDLKKAEAGEEATTGGGGRSYTSSGWWNNPEEYAEMAQRVQQEGWRNVYGKPWWETYRRGGGGGGGGSKKRYSTYGAFRSASEGRWSPYGGRWRPPYYVRGGPFQY